MILVYMFVLRMVVALVTKVVVVMVAVTRDLFVLSVGAFFDKYRTTRTRLLTVRVGWLMRRLSAMVVVVVADRVMTMLEVDVMMIIMMMLMVVVVVEVEAVMVVEWCGAVVVWWWRSRIG